MGNYLSLEIKLISKFHWVLLEKLVIFGDIVGEFLCEITSFCKKSCVNPLLEESSFSSVHISSLHSFSAYRTPLSRLLPAQSEREPESLWKELLSSFSFFPFSLSLSR